MYVLHTVPDNLGDFLGTLDAASLSQQRIKLFQNRMWLDTSLGQGRRYIQVKMSTACISNVTIHTNHQLNTSCGHLALHTLLSHTTEHMYMYLSKQQYLYLYIHLTSSLAKPNFWLNFRAKPAFEYTRLAQKRVQSCSRELHLASTTQTRASRRC